jgi:hypothetical protein
MADSARRERDEGGNNLGGAPLEQGARGGRLRERLARRRGSVLRRLRVALAEAEAGHAYSRAQELADEIKAVEARRPGELALAARKEHAELAARIAEHERHALAALERNLCDAVAEYERVSADQASTLRQAQARELRALERRLRDAAGARPPKYSPVLLEIREHVARLAAAHMYADAQREAQVAEARASEERTAAARAVDDEVNAALRQQREAHDKHARVIASKRSLGLEQLREAFARRREHLAVRLRSARRSAQQSASLKSRVEDDSDGVLIAAQKRCDAALLSVADAVSSLSVEAPEASPSCKLLAKLHLQQQLQQLELEQQQKQRHQQQRAQQQVQAARCGSSHAKARPRKAADEKAARPRTAPAAVCETSSGDDGGGGNCGRGSGAGSSSAQRPWRVERGAEPRARLAPIHALDAQAPRCNNCAAPCQGPLYRIPTDYIRADNAVAVRGVGEFCGWHCAAKWNRTHGPSHQRWLRHMFLQDAAKQMGVAIASWGSQSRPVSRLEAGVTS